MRLLISKQPEKLAFGQSNLRALAQPQCPLFRLFGYTFFTLLVLTGCSPNTPPPQGLPPTPVTTFLVEPTTVPAVMDFVGVAQSSHPVEIRARVQGYLDKIAYTEGAMVKEGDLLFQLDQKPYIAKLDNAKADLDKQQAILWNANTTVERLQPLYEQKAASKRDLDNAIAQKLSAEAEVTAAKARVVEAELNLGYTTITAPLTAMSGRSQYREGALITPGDQGLLTTLNVLDPIWVYFSVSDADILRYQTQTAEKQLVLPNDLNFEVQVGLSDGTMFPSHGKVDFADPSLNQGTGTMNVRAVFPNPDSLLRPGQFVRVYLHGAVRPNAIIVPQRALQEGSKGMFVYLVGPNDQAVMANVEPGPWYDDYWIIRTGLKAGDRVIVDGVNKVQVGTPLQVTKQLTYKSAS